jgi:hypothetical protein
MCFFRKKRMPEPIPDVKPASGSEPLAPESSEKDFSKFRFNDQEYNKARLVNAVLKAYVKQKPGTTYDQLKKLFPDSIQGSHGVFTLRSNAAATYKKTGHKRYYIETVEVIKLKDAGICTCNQWNKDNIHAFIEVANGLKMNIAEV